MGYFIRQLLILEGILDPVREIVCPSSNSHARLKNVKVYGAHVNLFQDLNKLLEGINLVGRRQNKTHRFYEIKFIRRARELPLRGGLFLKIPLDNLNNFLSKLADGGKLYNVYAGQPLGQVIFFQHIGYPVGKIIRRLRRNILVNLQEPVRVMIYAGARDLPDVFQELFQGRGLVAGQLRKMQPDAELKRFFCAFYRTHFLKLVNFSRNSETSPVSSK